MKRLHLFEFEDFPWFPQQWRQGLTAYIQALHRSLGTAKSIAPLVERGLEASNGRIVDLCSGVGGPMIDVARMLRNGSNPHCTLVMTDLYPGAMTGELSNEAWLSYDSRSINATEVPSDLHGMRTMVCSFHHMKPDSAEKILQHACRHKQPFLAFEISDNSSPSLLWWTAIPVGFLLSLVMTLSIRPLTIRQLFWTYVIPVLPCLIAWDGAVSNARTYSKDDLEELLARFPSTDYEWEIGRVKPRGLPLPMLYILGLPTSPTSSHSGVPNKYRLETA